jgi:hypothetical protein
MLRVARIEPICNSPAGSSRIILPRDDDESPRDDVDIGEAFSEGNSASERSGQSGETVSRSVLNRKIGSRRGSLATRTLRAAKQAILLRRSYQWNEGNDAQILASFCPSFLLQEISQHKITSPVTFFGMGACFIADISGFVKLCGRLSALGVNGIDDLRKCTNSFIGDLVNTVYKRGGDGEYLVVLCLVLRVKFSDD